jgi:hypothetical protein
MPSDRLLVAIAAIAVLLAIPRTAEAVHHTATPTPVPKCATNIPVVMGDTVASDKALQGAYFRFMTTAAERFGTISVPKGVWGYGIIRAVNPAGRRNQYGSVSLEPRYIALGHGKRIDVSMDPSIPVALTSRTPTVDQYASHIPIPIPGIAMSAVNLVRMGKNVTLGPGFPFAVVPLFDPTHNPGC